MDDVRIRIAVDSVESGADDGHAAPSFERDERYWYGEGWQQLRRNLVRFCLSESRDLLDLIGDGDVSDAAIAQAIRRYVDRLLSVIETRLRKASRADIWSHSLRLLAMPERIAAEIRRQRGRFTASDDDLAPEAMLGTILKAHFETMRRELQTEHSPHRLKIWEQIDRVSRELCGVNDDPSVRRSAEHLETLLVELQHRYPKSRNLPRSIETLEGYFLEFSSTFRPEPLEHHLEATLADDGATTMDDLDFLESVTGMKPDPLSCFQDLPRQHAEVFAVAHKLQADLLPDASVVFASARAYYLNKDISKRRFYSLVREATTLLMACLDHRIKRSS